MLADAATIVTRWTLKVYQAHKPVCISHLSSKAMFAFEVSGHTNVCQRKP